MYKLAYFKTKLGSPVGGSMQSIGSDNHLKTFICTLADTHTHIINGKRKKAVVCSNMQILFYSNFSLNKK